MSAKTQIITEHGVATAELLRSANVIEIVWKSLSVDGFRHYGPTVITVKAGTANRRPSRRANGSAGWLLPNDVEFIEGMERSNGEEQHHGKARADLLGVIPSVREELALLGWISL